MDLLGRPTIEFCEKAGSGIIKRPFYALSNFSFLIVGFIILSKKTRYSKAFGYTAIIVGLLSFGYDASYTYLSQLLDLLGMLLFVSLLIHISAKRFFFVGIAKLLTIQTLTVIAGLFCILYFKSFAGEFVFAAFIITEIILEFLLWQAGKTTSIKIWLISLGIFLLSFAIWLPDATRLWCDPNNIVNGRSIFHILNAITIYLLYRYYELQRVN